METFKSIIVLGILISCFIVFETPLYIALGILGLMLCAGSYKSRKDGGIDERYKFGCLSFIIGIILVIVSFIVYTYFG